jgi:hypothetical protein
MAQRMIVVFACLVVAVLAAPFVRDSWQWHQIRSSYPLDGTERAALANWEGSPGSFVTMLRGRCSQLHSADPQACTQYQQSAER